MPRLGDEVTVIEAPQEGVVLLGQLVFKDTEELGRQEPLFDAIVVIQGCLGAQAEVERREGMCLSPLKVCLHFRPVVDRLEGNLFDWGAGNDETVIVIILDFIEDVVVFF